MYAAVPRDPNTLKMNFNYNFLDYNKFSGNT